jgi:hypothetical protein
MAIRADILLLDVQPQLGAANGLPERHFDRVFEVAALFRAGFFDRAAAPAKYSGKDIFEA